MCETKCTDSTRMGRIYGNGQVVIDFLGKMHALALITVDVDDGAVYFGAKTAQKASDAGRIIASHVQKKRMQVTARGEKFVFLQGALRFVSVVILMFVVIKQLK